MNEVEAPHTCAKCGRKLEHILPLHSEATKTWLRKHGYDGAEWDEWFDSVKPFNFPYLPEPHEDYKGSRWVRFCLCLNCTSRDFKFTGEKEESEK